MVYSLGASWKNHENASPVINPEFPALLGGLYRVFLLILALWLDFGSLGISFEHMGVDFRHWEFILASGSQFWVSGIRFCNSGSQFWPLWYGSIFGLRDSILGHWELILALWSSILGFWGSIMGLWCRFWASKSRFLGFRWSNMSLLE